VFDGLVVDGDLVTAEWTDYSSTSTVTGWSSTSVKEIYYKAVGKLVFVAFYIYGTSNATSVTFTIPYTVINDPSGYNIMVSLIQARDNSGAWAAGMAQGNRNSSNIQCYPDVSASAWTASGTKVGAIMRTVEEGLYILLTALGLACIVLVLMFVCGVFRVDGISLARVLNGEQRAHMPLVFGGASPVPVITPTSAPVPTATPTPEPGALWTWVANAGLEDGNTVIYAVIPGYCCELVGQKSVKTIYVRAECPENPTCEIFPAPERIPPPFAWGDVEKLIYPASSREVCSTQWPFNCVGTK
jgi:hypothetical protein